MASTPEQPKLLELFAVFLRVSAVSIGGGYVMFPLLRSEAVDYKGWITEEEMVDYYALGQSIPGIIAMNTATLIGYRKRGIPGALAAAAGMATPSLITITLIAAFLVPWFDQPWVQKAFAGIRAAVLAMLVMALMQVAGKSLNSLVRSAVAACTFFAIILLHAHPVLMIALGGLLGFLLFRKETAR
jgi:chromate transporter